MGPRTHYPAPKKPKTKSQKSTPRKCQAMQTLYKNKHKDKVRQNRTFTLFRHIHSGLYPLKQSIYGSITMLVHDISLFLPVMPCLKNYKQRGEEEKTERKRATWFNPRGYMRKLEYSTDYQQIEHGMWPKGTVNQ